MLANKIYTEFNLISLETKELNELSKKICKDDDEIAFSKLFNYLYDRLYVFANKFVQNKESSEDIVADVFTKFWIGRKNTEIRNVLNYLYTSVYNAAISHINNINQYGKQVYLQEIEIELEEYTYNPELEMISNEEVDKINKAVAELPNQCRIILFLVRENNMKYKEVAQVLGISQKTVENQINIALRKIAIYLQIETDPIKQKALFVFMLA